MTTKVWTELGRVWDHFSNMMVLLGPVFFLKKWLFNSRFWGQEDISEVKKKQIHILGIALPSGLITTKVWTEISLVWDHFWKIDGFSQDSPRNKWSSSTRDSAVRGATLWGSELFSQRTGLLHRRFCLLQVVRPVTNMVYGFGAFLLGRQSKRGQVQRCFKPKRLKCRRFKG